MRGIAELPYPGSGENLVRGQAVYPESTQLLSGQLLDPWRYV